jgi:hypothetical protein
VKNAKNFFVVLECITKMNADAAPAPPATVENQTVTLARDIANDLAKDTYNQSVSSINMGFALAAAMAWNETIKKLIKTHVSQRLGSQYQFMYAVLVTLLAAVVFSLTKRYVKPSLKRTDITPVVGLGY